MPRLSRRAQKDLAQLPDAIREKAEGVIERLDTEPALGKKLKGKLDGVRSARLGRSYRILYEVAQDEVRILTVSLRRDSYR